MKVDPPVLSGKATRSRHLDVALCVADKAAARLLTTVCPGVPSRRPATRICCTHPQAQQKSRPQGSSLNLRGIQREKSVMSTEHRIANFQVKHHTVRHRQKRIYTLFGPCREVGGLTNESKMLISSPTRVYRTRIQGNSPQTRTRVVDDALCSTSELLPQKKCRVALRVGHELFLALRSCLGKRPDSPRCQGNSLEQLRSSRLEARLSFA